MFWCLALAAVGCLLLALVALTMRAPRLARIRPQVVVRSCLALVFLIVALGLAALALGLARPELLAIP